MIRAAVRPLAVVAALALWTGCSHGRTLPPPLEPVASAPVVSDSAHVAFAGGGWRAHTGHSGWVLALLHDGRTLDEAFAHVGAISSNSGGSWFNTMLAYSPPFVADVEAAAEDPSAWARPGSDAGGWLGRQWHLFEAADCEGYEWLSVAFTECVLDRETGGHGLTWHDVVTDLVFSGYQVRQPLGGPRQLWAEDKVLLLAATMLTDEVEFDDQGGRVAYQACPRPALPAYVGDGRTTCTGDRPADVTPVTFASLPEGSAAAAPPFFGQSAAETGPLFRALYVGPGGRVQTPLTAPPTTADVPVMDAAAASSAAVGFAASRDLSRARLLAYEFSDAALAFALRDGPAYQPDLEGAPAAALALGQVVQLADGGAVDNSAVAQLVAFLQQNGPADGFEIVAFDNVEAPYVPEDAAGRAAGPRVGSNVAALFGAPSAAPTTETCIAGFCLRLPPLAVFDAAALRAPAGPAWRASPEPDDSTGVRPELIYTPYAVTTLDNPAFGVTAGTTGTLHAFSAIWPGAPTAPGNDGADFEAYRAMLAYIVETVREGGGLPHLEAALGLAPR